MNYIADRRLEEKDRRRSTILGAAETEAARRGIDGLTMEQVARRARTSRALLYVYFRDRIAAIGRAYLAFSQEFPVYFAALARFQAQESAPGPATDCAGACLAAGARVRAIMFAAIEAGQRDGSIDPGAGAPVAIALTLWGFMHGIIQLAATKGAVLAEYGLTARALGEQALRLAAGMLLPACAAAAAADETARPARPLAEIVAGYVRGGLDANLALADQSLEVERSLAALARTPRRDIAVAYFNWLKAGAGARIVLDSSALLQENQHVSVSLYANGKVTEDYVLRARAELLGVQQQQREAGRRAHAHSGRCRNRGRRRARQRLRARWHGGAAPPGGGRLRR